MKNLQNQITQLKSQLEEEKKKHKSETEKLEKIIQAKNNEIEQYKSKDTYDMVENSSSVILDQLNATKKLNVAFQTDIQKKALEINNFKKEVSELKNEKILLQEKIEQLNINIKDLNTQYETVKNNFELIKKQKDALKEKEEKFNEQLEEKYVCLYN